MKSSKRIPVDFGNADEDGAVRLVTRGTMEYCKDHNIVLSEGLRVTMSDGEVTAEGTVARRAGIWVARVEKWL